MSSPFGYSNPIVVWQSDLLFLLVKYPVCLISHQAWLSVHLKFAVSFPIPLFLSTNFSISPLPNSVIFTFVRCLIRSNLHIQCISFSVIESFGHPPWIFSTAHYTSFSEIRIDWLIFKVWS